MWAQLFYLLRTGRVREAVEEAIKNRSVLDSRQRDFVGQFQKWAHSDEPKLVSPSPVIRLMTSIDVTCPAALVTRTGQHIEPIWSIRQLWTRSRGRYSSSWEKLSPINEMCRV